MEEEILDIVVLQGYSKCICGKCGSNTSNTERLHIRELPSKENNYKGKTYFYYDNLHCSHCLKVIITDGSYPFDSLDPIKRAIDE